ncbi:HAMP domain-containing histidine kinase [Acidaminobacter sp. JC074]|uniref:sensor histidine kinase n=1 Tax=Acidaminobacter sp. JC074 TaxID=2530199 RepID=UPI001F107F51|nr:HAMP domain-containing sensor histidine kinase [Acidaminobacter sp. JC074]MCH4891229.1 HAMP domain-containing histidine kinase [Acidaminobacter sp. JC074]
MKKEEKLCYRERRQTLRGRLQRSLSLSSALSVGISLISVLIVIIILVQPVGRFFTDTVSNRVYNNYIVSSELIGRYKNHGKMDNLQHISFDEIVSMYQASNYEGDMDQEFREIRESFNDEIEPLIIEGNSITGDIISETEKKSILISTTMAIDEIYDILSINSSWNFDLVNVRLEIQDEEIFKIPGEFNVEAKSFAQKWFSDIQTVLPVVNEDGVQIGSLTTSLNTNLLTYTMIPVVLLFIVIAGMTLLVVKIILLPIAYRLLKPIHVLNNQLKKIAEEDEIECGDIIIEQRKPPTEIKILIDYSNQIISKLQSSYHILENVNDELEAQRDELEAQNIELDAQKDELEAQNHELLEAQEQIRRTQAQLVQSEKMASMGQLTAAIMHEINTPLGAVQSNNQMSQMMLTKLKSNLEKEEFEASIKIVEKLNKSNSISVDAANRVSEIIRNLKNFSRVDQADFQNADIIEGIKSVLVLTSNLWKNKLTIHEEYKALPLISCFPSMLNQVFMNLIVNSVQATEKGGNLTIYSDHNEDHVYIAFKDDGSGIDPNDINHIFDNGFTTKPKDEGTGLGLSISREIIEKHGGIIEAFNNEDKGATFKITLPIKQNCDADMK